MKKFLFLSCIVLMFCSCKQQQSNVSDYAEKVECKSYLYASATGEDTAHTPLVCRFLCTGDTLPKQENKSSVCSSASAIFIKRSIIENSSFSNLLVHIDNTSDVIAKMDQSTASKLNSLFENAWEFYSTSLGEPVTVCGNVLNSTTSAVASEPVCETSSSGSIVSNYDREDLFQKLKNSILSIPECSHTHTSYSSNYSYASIITEASFQQSCLSKVSEFLEQNNYVLHNTSTYKKFNATDTLLISKDKVPELECKDTLRYTHIRIQNNYGDNSNKNIVVEIRSSFTCSDYQYYNWVVKPVKGSVLTVSDYTKK